jgi:hypothetical protein
VAEKLVRAWVLTDEPRPDGSRVDMAGVRYLEARDKGFVYLDDGRGERPDTVVGEPVQFMMGRVDEYSPKPLGILCMWRWLFPPPPGRYSADGRGVITKRDPVSGDILEVQLRSVAIRPYRPGDEEACTFVVSEEEGNWKRWMSPTKKGDEP